MIEYIYFVKCPNCEEEHFNFFDDAKEFALGCLSNKPIITQVEVNRNDFGECTDSADLGTIWSWEDMMKDIPAEPVASEFSKVDTFEYDPDHDPDFDTLDNSVDFEIDAAPDNFSMPSNLEEAYYAVIEVDGEERRFPFNTREETREYVNSVRAGKDPAFKGKKLGSMYTESCNNKSYRKPVPADMTIEALVEEMEENEDTVECKWCHELFDKSEVRYEVDLGYLCDQCSAAIKSRGETLTFKEVPYDDDSLNETFDSKETVELFYDSLTATITGPKRDVDDWDEAEYSDSYTYDVSKEDIATAIWENFITEEDVADVPGGLEALEDDTAWNRFLETHFDILFEKYYGQLLKYYEDNAMESFESSISWDDINESKTKSMLEELEEPGAYRERLTLCPECGSESFDVEASLCISCGFNTLEEDMSNKYYQATKNRAKIEVCRYNDYIPGKYCALTAYAYDQEIPYYVSCDEVVDALTELVDDAYIQFQTDETDKLRTVEALRNAGKLREFFMDDLSTHIHNYYREINDYFIDEWEDELELECEDDLYF